MKASISLLIVICGLTKALIREHFYLNIQKNWTDAQSYCRKYYTDLSTVTSQEEQDMLIQLARGNSIYKWIGLYKNTSNIKQFLWSDGNSFSYSKWQRGQPNNVNGDQNCVFLQYNWFDYECYKLQTFFCYKMVFSLVKEKRTWDEALQYCRTHHTDLASMTTERQLQMAKQMTVESQTESVWTGLRYLVGECSGSTTSLWGIKSHCQSAQLNPVVVERAIQTLTNGRTETVRRSSTFYATENKR
ncbi:Lectin [Anabarilius grahami]|uniref:Lectin n=1 Tax=Anabarilius grahami TaxID=495550 RepID=A0A3N0YA67_ANAGA|nr:Lectin [Anabarilius grahami]